MLAANFENLLFLLLVAAAVLFQLLAKAAGKTTKDQTKPTSGPIPRTPPPIPHAPTESDEERIRKLLEALGQPPTSKPPRPVVPRTEISPRPLAPVQPPTIYPPPLWKLTREERRKRDIIPRESSPPPSVRHTEEIVPPKITGAPAFEIHEGPLLVESPPRSIKAATEAYGATTRTIAKTEEPKTAIVTLLASTSGLRDAIILREILGRPRGLRMEIDFSEGIL